jgi:hypothetical protein
VHALTPLTDALDRKRDVKSYTCATGNDVALSEHPDTTLYLLTTQGVACATAMKLARTFAARRDCQVDHCSFQQYTCQIVSPEEHLGYSEEVFVLCERRDKAKRLRMLLSFAAPAIQHRASLCRSGQQSACPK